MVIAVARPILLFLHHLGGRIQDDFRRCQRSRFLGPLHRCAKGLVPGIGFGRGRDVDRRLRQRQFPFGRAKKIISVLGSQCLVKRVRISQPHVLDRHAHQPPRQEQRILARRQHPRQIIQRRIGIGAAHRLVQCGDQIVMPVRRLVIKRHALLH